MKLEHIISKYTLSKSAHPPSQLTGVKSAVLVPLIEFDGQTHILLCKRNANLRAHPSQICFPGGKIEAHDSSVQDAALRETFEEISLAREFVTPLGQLATHSSLSGFHITPILAKIENSATWARTSSEVDHVFTLPIRDLMIPEHWQSYTTHFRGKVISIKGFMTPHGLLWGATASIITKFTNSLI
ncbi:CoA pyrophosphatase [Pseudoalteromonas luteoviolacea]|uniref:NUDIX hydrolase n=1 Tax=Pseudoalteromonas luteoviolacea TaxID=43657 RepID=UPI001B385CAF|nr:CoA pyrophosphatase [Pseudoalteromonas luteoviolacea]MBQ4814116.1 CoA pyrophosphatase [Pseudoalteromonas luteoviolacea]